jgi:hypothetical protein
MLGVVLLLLNTIPVMALQAGDKAPDFPDGQPRRFCRQAAGRGVLLRLRLYQHLNAGSLGLST